MKIKKYKVSILVPTYNGSSTIVETLNCLLEQSYNNFNIIVHDDCSTDNTIELVKSISDPRIEFYINSENLGYPGNLEAARKKARGEIIYLMGQDDILSPTALEDTVKAFNISNQIGAVTRPYYWFDEEVGKPVRAKKQLNPCKDEVVTINDDFDRIEAVFRTLDQLSGLAYRREFIKEPFHPAIFPCHVYPFADILKRHPVVYLKDYNLAVRIAFSQARHLSSIYDESPMKTWVTLFNDIFHEVKFKKFRDYMIKEFVATNYVGLVQIRNFGRKYRFLWREIEELVKLRPKNLANPAFWFFAMGTALIPPRALIPMVDWYKISIGARLLKRVGFPK